MSQASFSSNKRAFPGRGYQGGRKFTKAFSTRSFNMVATLKDESKDVKLRLPATRENWLHIEQQIRSAATELEIMPLLDGIYVVKPLFPKIPMTKY